MISATFLMPTCGRAARQPDIISEAVYWLLRQTYDNFEILILNDAPGHRLICDDPRVNVVNCPERFKTLGEKMNMMLAMAHGTLCLVAEDDDISLPWRATQAAGALANYDYWSPKLWWYAEEGKRPVADSAGVGHNCAAFRRDAMIGAYQPITRGHDAAIDSWARANLRVNPVPLTNPAEISYFYRWGVSQFHLSGHSDMESAYGGYDPGPPGEYTIVPRMIRDYAVMHWGLTNGPS